MSAWFSHVDGRWEEPRFAAMLRRLASMGRLIVRSLVLVNTGARLTRAPDYPNGLEQAQIDRMLEAEAATGGILCSSPVKELVTGSDLSFVDRGRKQLKGVPQDWQIHAVSWPASCARSVAPAPSP